MEINLCKWMEKLDGSKPVLEYNLVGTHDSVTQYVQFSFDTRCQDRNIYDQLCLGVRMLDIRVESKGERLKLVHAFAKTFNTPNRLGKQMDMADVLSHCYCFLKENPSETIVFQFKNDNGRENEKCFNNLFYTYIKGNEDKWFLENCVPTLDEARGKLILVRRCKMENREEYTEKNTGIDFSRWAEQDALEPIPLPLETGGENSVTFVIFDRYKYRPVPRWNDCIKPFLDKAKPFAGEYILNYLSTAGGIKGPYRNAKYINAQFL
ncbi:MAG: phosphatidylinositol-specific phospholipase C domain-containing protein, partial [Eubacterium sp.]|nr:phosphatidylinositol-specific phospholipase C domain-containing protein [Eubacterium sp.]